MAAYQSLYLADRNMTNALNAIDPCESADRFRAGSAEAGTNRIDEEGRAK